MLDIADNDTNAVKSAKKYYRALLNSDVQQAILLHSTNFSTFTNELHGSLSGIQLITIDFINNEFDKALQKIDRINADRVPEALYWRAKINQSMQRHNDAISVSQNFIRRHGEHQLVPKVWLILLESFYARRDVRNFERNLTTFSSHKNFNEYQAYLLYLHGLLLEESNRARARTIYSQVINEFPRTQFRVQAEDRLYAMRTAAEAPTQPTTTTQRPPTTPTPPVPTPENNNNVVVSRYEDLTAGAFYVQFGVFSTENAARNYVNTLARDGISAFHITKPVGGRRLFAVIQGPHSNRADAQANVNSFNARNIQTFIFRAD